MVLSLGFLFFFWLWFRYPLVLCVFRCIVLVLCLLFFVLFLSGLVGLFEGLL